MPKAVFAGCARSCAPFLKDVLANIEALGATYEAFEIVIVENDSEDDTRSRLREVAGSRDNVRLIEADGLEERHPKRTDRIAAARNLYIEAVREPRYADCDDLVVLDFDDVNCRPINASAFAAAREWLWQEPNRRAVFANSSLFYYDVWALRHPSWSPDDCWARVRSAQKSMGMEEAMRRHVATRQIPIRPGAAPILVDSAFGGLGIYRREPALTGNYVGLDEQGEETCEHVAFNAAVRGDSGTMAIYPRLQNETPQEHILASLGPTRTFGVEQDGARGTLLGPPDHPLESFRASEPLYDRRLPVLARIVSAHAPNAAFIDVGANIGDSIALARLAGARMPVIAIEASLTYCKFLWLNARRLPALFRKTNLVWGFAGGTGAKGQVSLGAGTASAAGSGSATTVESAPRMPLSAVAKDLDVSLLKTDTDGFDQDIVAAELAFLRAKQPILWLEAQTLAAADEAKWRSLLESMADQWPNMILFDNFGFAIAAGATRALTNQAVELMAYGRRQRERANYRPTLYYLDVALFPARFDRVYDEFRRSIPELAA
jgi:FkbM family methyltransferase